ncbi:helix-turn-helix domain-containing protein [Chromobacterium haemolyticum]|uniref:helix-turn-helix domain-containing protein n=1 Tax=Chromobacterium haemolyticum TaxID=394935 RepID=UPI004055BD4C
MHPLAKAAELVGGFPQLAKELGRTRAAVWQWMQEGRSIPAEHCPLIEKLTNGKVRCEELNPNVRWDVLRMNTKSLGEAKNEVSMRRRRQS